MVPQHLEQWRRGPRSSFSLGADNGVYALFLRPGAGLPGIQPGKDGLLYIGLAANRDGLKGRCHFDARTVNHSPRKSLAALLKGELSLRPVLVPKPNTADTWGLDKASDARLTEWMHTNLELAVEVTDHPDARETELVCLFAPPLNLTKCVQTEQHRKISRARKQIMASLRNGGPTPPSAGKLRPATQKVGGPKMNDEPFQADGRDSVVPGLATAETIARRYGLNAKSYRRRLRASVPWYRRPQDWTFAVGSAEWRDMIAVAEAMVRAT